MSAPVSVKSEEEVILENAEYNSAEELDEELQLQLEDTGGESYHIQYSDDGAHYSTATTTAAAAAANTSSAQRHHSNQSSRGNLCSSKPLKAGASLGMAVATSKSIVDSEKRMRREIANSNERRRMQSINAGFQNLRSLLPRHEGEKLSKAAILQQTSQYICELEDQKTQLLAQNSQLKRQLGQHESSGNGAGGGGGGTASNAAEAVGNDFSAVAIKKRKLTDNVINMQVSDSSDEGLGSMSPEPMTLLNATNVNQKQATTNVLAQTAAKELLELKKQLDKERRLRTMLEDELQMIKRQLYSVATAPAQSTGANYIPREVIEHTDNIVREEDLPAGTVSYVEIDEMTGQQQVVVCTSIEELESESGAAGDLITEDHLQEEIILSTTSSTESEQEVNAIAKAYAEGKSPAAIKATPKVEVERIDVKVKTEKIEQTAGLTRSRQNLETIVEAIRHLEGDHLFGDGADQQKQQQQQQQQKLQKAQEAPLALTTQAKQLQLSAQRNTLAELRPFLQLKSGGKQPTMTLIGGTSIALANTNKNSSSGAQATATSSSNGNTGHQKDTRPLVTPTAILKVQTNSTSPAEPPQVTITSTALKQCRPGVIVAKQVS